MLRAITRTVNVRAPRHPTRGTARKKKRFSGRMRRRNVGLRHGFHWPAAPPPLAAVQILNGPSAGKELELTKNLTTLGKPGVQVAVITRRPQGYFITHVEGASFPVVNGKALDAQAHPLKDHDVIELTGVKMEFFIKTR